ncbi:hypothetical protein ACFJGV_10885 [Cnuibacter sp. UC19_7]|uniref:hypothetical protein n=1 Tax=Cnuibacter sp. UC19_7 TaxID=3350166 RepID=UPI00366DA545
MNKKAGPAALSLFQQLTRLSLAPFEDYSDNNDIDETVLFRTHDGRFVRFRVRSEALATLLPELKRGASEALGYTNPGLREAGRWLASMITEKAEDMSSPGAHGYDLTAAGFIPRP